MSEVENNAGSSAKDRTPSSASSGVFMRTPVLENQYHADSSLTRVAGLYLPQSIVQDIAADLSRFGDEVISKKVLDWTSDAERNVPYIKGSGRDAFGRRTDELVTTEGWRNLQKMGLREGIVATAYENEYAEYSRVVQFLKYHLWTGSCAFVTCPSAMQDGAASLLLRHVSTSPQNSSLSTTARTVFGKAFTYLKSRDGNAWTSGQWMTERVGGSDVSGTETLATYSPTTQHKGFEATQIDGLPLGPWIIDGFKWFSSATDSQMSIALAQTPKGLSAFYIPMRRTTPSGESELNGIIISRLKSKLGTKALPTAELELRGAKAFLLGEEGNGVREISTVLNITRVHNAVTSLGLWGRGLAIAKAFSNVREMAGKGTKKNLKDVPLHVHTLTDMTVSYRAHMLFTFFVVYCLGMSDKSPAGKTLQRSFASDWLRPHNPQDLQLILRVLTPAIKAVTAKASISGLQECMESLGGVGYLENEESQHVNVARLYRDTNVLAIWEGTTNVLATDFVKILKGRNGEKTLTALQAWLNHAFLGTSSEGAASFDNEKSRIVNSFKSFNSEIAENGLEKLLVRARELMDTFAAIVMGTLMIVDVERDGDAVSAKMAQRFAASHSFGGPYKSDWASEIAWDSKIVFGEPLGEVAAKSRL